MKKPWDLDSSGTYFWTTAAVAGLLGFLVLFGIAWFTYDIWIGWLLR